MHRDNGHSDARRFHERVETRKVRNGFEIWGAGFGAGAYSTEWGSEELDRRGWHHEKSLHIFRLLSACFLRGWVWHWLTKTTSYEVILKGEVGWHHSEKSQILNLDETPSRVPKVWWKPNFGCFPSYFWGARLEWSAWWRIGDPHGVWGRKVAIVSSDDPFIKKWAAGKCGVHDLVILTNLESFSNAKIVSAFSTAFFSKFGIVVSDRSGSPERR